MAQGAGTLKDSLLMQAVGPAGAFGGGVTFNSPVYTRQSKYYDQLVVAGEAHPPPGSVTIGPGIETDALAYAGAIATLRSAYQTSAAYPASLATPADDARAVAAIWFSIGHDISVGATGVQPHGWAKVWDVAQGLPPFNDQVATFAHTMGLTQAEAASLQDIISAAKSVLYQQLLSVGVLSAPQSILQSFFSPGAVAIASLFTAGSLAVALGTTSAVASAGATGASQGAAQAATSATLGSAGAASAGAVAGATTGAVKSGASAAAGAASSAAGGVVGNIATGIKSALAPIVNTVGNIEQAIAKPLQAVASLANDINNGLIKPIVQPIEQTYAAVNSLITSVQQDIHGGLQGILQIPSAIANALTSTDAAFKRAITELGAGNQALVKDLLVPGLAGPIDGIAQSMGGTWKPAAGARAGAVDTREAYELSQAANADQIIAQAKGMIEGINSADDPFSWLVNAFYNVTLVLEIIGTAQGWKRQVVEYARNEANPVTILGVGEILQAKRDSYIDEATARAELLKHGYDPSHQDVLLASTKFIAPPELATRWYFRGEITEAEWSAVLDQASMDQAQQTAFKAGAYELLAIRDMLDLWFRGLWSDADIERGLLSHGLQADVAKLVIEAARPVASDRLTIRVQRRLEALDGGFFPGADLTTPPQEVLDLAAHGGRNTRDAINEWVESWDILGPFDWANMYFRGLTTLDQVFAAFTAHNIPQEIHQSYLDGMREIIPFYFIPPLLKSGTLTAEQGKQQLAALGYTPQLIDVIVAGSVAPAATSKATTAVSLQQASLSQAASMYQDQIITEEQYKSILAAHGYAPDFIDATVRLENLKLVQSLHSTEGTILVDQVALGQITQQQAIDQMASLGFSTAESLKYQKQILGKQTTNAKLPSLTEVKDMWKAGIITDADLLEFLGLTGYGPTWGPRMFTLLTGKVL